MAYDSPSNRDILGLGLKNLVYIKPSPSITRAPIKTYDSYIDCYNDVLSQAPSSTNTETAKAQKLTELFASAGGFDFLKSIETKYTCAGICKIPLFYMTKQVNIRPTTECGMSIIKEIGSFLLIVGYLSALSGFLYLIAFCGSFSACAGPDHPNGDEADAQVDKEPEEVKQSPQQIDAIASELQDGQ